MSSDLFVNIRNDEFDDNIANMQYLIEMKYITYSHSMGVRHIYNKHIQFKWTGLKSPVRNILVSKFNVK